MSIRHVDVGHEKCCPRKIIAVHQPRSRPRVPPEHGCGFVHGAGNRSGSDPERQRRSLGRRPRLGRATAFTIPINIASLHAPTPLTAPGSWASPCPHLLRCQRHHREEGGWPWPSMRPHADSCCCCWRGGDAWIHRPSPHLIRWCHCPRGQFRYYWTPSFSRKRRH